MENKLKDNNTITKRVILNLIKVNNYLNLNIKVIILLNMETIKQCKINEDFNKVILVLNNLIIKTIGKLKQDQILKLMIIMQILTMIDQV